MATWANETDLLLWWAKNLDERKTALNELRFSRVGRRARLKGEVVTIASLAGMLGTAPPQDVAVADPTPKRSRSLPKAFPREGQSGLTEGQEARFRRDFRGLDIAWLEREFQAWVVDKEPPNDYVAALYRFMQGKQNQQRDEF